MCRSSQVVAHTDVRLFVDRSHEHATSKQPRKGKGKVRQIKAVLWCNDLNQRLKGNVCEAATHLSTLRTARSQ